MAVLFFLLAVVSVIALIVGLIKPSLVVFWGKKRGRGKAVLTYVGALILFIVLGTATTPGNSAQSAAAPAQTTTKTTSSPPANKTTPVKTTDKPKPKPESKPQPDFVIKLTGTKGTKVTIAVDEQSFDGSSTENSYDATVPYTLPIPKAYIISVEAQNQGSTGTVDLQIIQHGKVVKEAQTSAQYGVVSAAAK